MIPGDHPLWEAYARLEALLGRLEAGEPVEARLQAALERQVAVCAMPVAEDLAEVRAALEALLREPARRHLRRLRAAIEAALAVPPEEPTPSPRANAVLGLALAALADPEVDFAGEARGLAEEIAGLASRMAALGRAGASARGQEEVQRVVEASARAREALVDLEVAVEGGDGEAVRAGGERLIAGVRTLASAQRALARLAEHEGKTPCVRCGCYNPGGRSTCEECGAILPAAAVVQDTVLDVRVGDEPGTRETRMTENLARLFDACDQFYTGSLDPEDFLEEVAWMEGLLAQARRLGLGDSEAARLGADDFAAGLALLRQAAETGDGALVDPGRRMVWEGAGKLQGD